MTRPHTRLAARTLSGTTALVLSTSLFAGVPAAAAAPTNVAPSAAADVSAPPPYAEELRQAQEDTKAALESTQKYLADAQRQLASLEPWAKPAVLEAMRTDIATISTRLALVESAWRVVARDQVDDARIIEVRKAVGYAKIHAGEAYEAARSAFFTHHVAWKDWSTSKERADLDILTKQIIDAVAVADTAAGQAQAARASAASSGYHGLLPTLDKDLATALARQDAVGDAKAAFDAASTRHDLAAARAKATEAAQAAAAGRAAAEHAKRVLADAIKAAKDAATTQDQEAKVVADRARAEAAQRAAAAKAAAAKAAAQREAARKAAAEKAAAQRAAREHALLTQVRRQTLAFDRLVRQARISSTQAARAARIARTKASRPAYRRALAHARSAQTYYAATLKARRAFLAHTVRHQYTLATRDLKFAQVYAARAAAAAKAAQRLPRP